MNLKYQFDHLSVPDYLEGELHSTINHEYIDGEVYVMAGESSSHNRIVANALSELRFALKDTPCEPFTADMKVLVGDDFFYPDVLVACHHKGNDYGVTDSPLLIVEVLSKATLKTDYAFKRLAYQRLASFQEYVVIEQDIADIEICRRTRHWQSEHYFLGDEMYFESIDVSLPVSTIYERVENEDVLGYLQLLHENVA